MCVCVRVRARVCIFGVLSIGVATGLIFRQIIKSHLVLTYSDTFFENFSAVDTTFVRAHKFIHLEARL